MEIKYYNRIRNIILIWNIYLTILIPFVVLLSGIWHLESGVRHGKAAGLPIAVILAFLPLVLFGLKWKWIVHLQLLHLVYGLYLCGKWHITSFMIRQTHRLFIIVR